MAAKGKAKGESMAVVDAPLPLVTIDPQGKFVVGPEASTLIRQIKGDIAVIAVAGIYRTGKSYILNRLLGKQQGFAVGPTVNPCTKGIYIWGRPLVLEREDEGPLNILLVDTEGIGSIQQDQTYDVKIFSLAILLSSYFVYNSMSIIDERALDGLSLVVNLTKQISARSNSGGGKNAAKGRGKSSVNGANSANSSDGKGISGEAVAELADYFPHFLWLLRDFALDLVDEKGAAITSRQYLENALKERPEPAQQSKNQIRSTIKQLFRERDCVALVRPVVDEKQLKTIDAIAYNQLRPEFRQQSDELVKKILDEAPPKQINGQNLTGESFAQLIQIYAESINSGAVASIQSAWESLSAQVNHQAMEEAQHAWTSGINAKYNPNRPLNDDHLQALHLECMNEAFGIYDAMAYHGPQSVAMRKQLKAKMVAEYARLAQSNREASARFVLRLLGTLYEPLEAQAKSGAFKTMDALLEAWQTLQKKFFEQLGDAQASRVVAYDEFLKFFSTHLATTSGHVTKAITAAHTEQIEVMKKKLEQLTADKHASELASVKAVEENKRLTSQLATAEKRVKSLETDIATANENWKSAQSQLTKATAEASKASSEAMKATAELKVIQSTAQAAEAKFNAEIATLKASLKEKTKSFEDKHKEVEVTRKRIETLEAVVSTTKQSLEKNEKSASEKLKVTEQAMAGDKQKLQTALEKALREKDGLEARKTKMESEHQQLLAERDTYAQEISELRATQKKQLAKEVAPLREQIQTLQTQLGEAKAELKTVTSAQASAHLDQKTKSTAALSTLTKERDEARREKEALQQEIIGLHQQHVDEVTPLTAELEERMTEIAELKRDLAQAKKMAKENAQMVSSTVSAPTAAAPRRASVTKKTAAVPSDSEEENDVEMMSQDEEIEPLPKPTKKASAKRAAKSTPAVSKKVAAPVLDEMSEEEEEKSPPRPKVVAKAVSTPVSTPKRSAVRRTPAPAPQASSSNAMDVDVELPTPRSRKRVRASDSSETAELHDHEVETPSKKKAQNDPEKMDKSTLKSTLTAAGVKLPPGDHPKNTYIKLFHQKFNINGKK